LNLPNLLTISRFLLTGAFIFVVLSDDPASKFLALLIFIIASVTDFIDGYLARKNDLHTDFGKIMDPIADKFLILSAFYLFSYLGIFAFWLFCVIAAREILVTLIRFYAIGRGQVLAAEGMGKVKTVSQIASVIIILVFLILVEAPFAASWPEEFFSAYSNGIVLIMYYVASITIISGLSFLKSYWGVGRVR